ncbi:RNA polymerase sigma factor sigF, chloroplastic isoform X2 [Brachypodium distachyon]|uniref:RNA polymerase sigma factor sigF, chloroplastic isoform X2 n=1 Tax=Brachypodium distachyon TaxID=15368 RepID=UPI00052FE8FC|nr:RNA polymerase sigma factor sigF, chloroplastic isoform X2 [Brachypodium distachyon]|eukprot:XP_010229645.1 RNA polymerase sigma factor sigF, chloroplastic isoform X2 [Brachypodium distachyon]
MNSSRSLLSSPLFPTSSPNFRSTASSPTPSRTSVPMMHDSTGRASTACHYSPSLVAEEQVHGSVSLKGEKALLELLLDMALEQHTQGKKVTGEEGAESEFESYLRDLQRQVIYQQVLGEEYNSTSVSTSTLSIKSSATLDLGATSATVLKEVAFLPEESGTSAAELDVTLLHRLDLNHSYEKLLSKGQVFIRSKRLLERRSKKRDAPRASSTDALCGVVDTKKKEKSKKYGRVLDPDEPFKLFLRDPETTEFLTAKEEKQLFSEVQNLMKLEEAQRRLEAQCGREPAIEEWAKAVGMSCKDLQSSIHIGRRCREKMARSNFRLVIHVARKYQGYGLDIEDLVQDGCCGLMKTFEKFNPSKGCRFPTYAYWWIRQAIKKSIFKHSRLIRLPESVYALLKKVGKARLECILEGEQPTNENVARRAGITIEKLAKLKAKTRKSRSLQDRVWPDDGVTFQEITEDPNIEPPDLVVDRMMMRQQVRDFLGILSTREKEIIEHRFGIYDGEPKTLHVIGDMYGLSKERIRQLQNRALDKLKRSVSNQGFDVYLDLLTSRG